MKHDWVGLRVANWRNIAGMTQQELADRVSISREHLSRIENGRRAVERRGLLLALATALGVRVEDLTGEPRMPMSAIELSAWRMVPAIRHAIEEPDEDITPRPLRDLARLAGEARVRHMACDYPALGELLPALLAETRAAYHAAPDEHARRDALTVYARATLTAAFSLKTMGHLDLAVRVAERGSTAAELLGDPVCQAAAEFTAAQMALAQGCRRRSLRLASRAADAIAVDHGGDERRTWYGMLSLHAALSAATLGRTDEAATRFAEAAEAATRTTSDPWLMELNPGNVGAWKVAIALEGDDPAKAPEIARRVDRGLLRTLNRQARLGIDTARGWHAAGKPDEAARTFLAVGEIAPQELTRPEVREIVGQMVRDARRAGGYEDLRALAVRVGIDPLDPPDE